MNKKTKLILGIIALVVLIGGSTVLYQTLIKNYSPENRLGATVDTEQPPKQSDKASPETTEPLLAPDFSMEDKDGNLVKLSDFIGKPIVLNFWASWCPPCKEEMPDFDKVFAEKGEEINFIMLNATDGGRETKEKAKAFLDKQGFSFPVYYDTTQEASYTYGVSSLPTTLFIDKDGYLVTGSIGMIDESTLRKGIEMILPQESSSADSIASQNISASGYTKIDAVTAQSLMKESTDFILLDTRTQAEFSEEHLEGALLIPDTEIQKRAETELPNKNQAIFVYCRSGRRSEQAAKALVEMGYSHIYDFGGIIDWPYDTVK